MPACSVAPCRRWAAPCLLALVLAGPLAPLFPIDFPTIQEEADAISAEAKSRVDTLEARFDALKTAAAAYKEEFSRLLDSQANALRESNGLF